MRSDLYLRALLTIIAGALVYLCIVLTPVPGAHAQQPARGALRPGDDTGPGEMVIVGVRMPQGAAIPVFAESPIPVSGDVRVSGRVQTEQLPNVLERVVIAGWENDVDSRAPGRLEANRFHRLREGAPGSGEGLPVMTVR